MSGFLAFAVFGHYLPVHGQANPAAGQNGPNRFALGFEFANDLAEARATAVAESKILMLIPAAWRSSAENDGLSPAVEAFRAGPLVDDRVVRLIKRRYVPYYFELDERGTRYDPVAAALTLDLCPELKFPSVMPTPPVIFATPEGKLLATITVYCTTAELVSMLAATVDQNEPYRELTGSEAALEPLERAQALWDLRQFDKCLELLEGDHSSHAWFLRGAIACEREAWEDMESAFEMVTDDAWSDDITLYRIRRYRSIGNFDGIRQIVEGMPETNPRYQEALYYLGLAHFHSGERDEAFRTWEKAILANTESAWSLRLDWTLGLARRGPDAVMLSGPPESLLNRVFLSPHGNADLKR